MKKQFVIGVDIGGTNTDGVLIDKSQEKIQIIQHCKTLTSPKDVTEGFKNCIQILIEKQTKQDPSFNFEENVAFIIIGTTHFINEIIQKSPGTEKLDKVGVIRLCSQVSHEFQSYIHIENEDLLKRIQGPAYYCDGGIILSFPSFQPMELTPFNEKQIIDCLENLKQNNIHHIAVNQVGCLIDPAQEKKVRQIIEKFEKDNDYPLSYTLSHQICNKNGVIYRENAAILNESLKYLAQNTFDSIQVALNTLNLNQVPFVISKNDGSFFTRQQCQQFPILCSSASIVNSLKGGQLLYNVKQSEIGIVIDIGGTSTDMAILYHGSARESGKHLNIGGVQFNSERMPQVSTIALGGGSIIKVFRDQDNTPQLQILKQSIAKNIKQQSICCNEFSKDKNLLLCTSDFAIQFNSQLESSLQADKTRLSNFLKSGSYTLENQEYIMDFNDEEIKNLLDLYKQQITQKLVKLIDSASNGKDQMNILLCGGGSLVVDRQYLRNVMSPNLILQDYNNSDYIGAANALGATQFDITKSTSTSYLLNTETDDYISDENGGKQVNWEKLIKTQEQKLQKQILDSGIGQGPFINLECDYGPTPYGLENQVDMRVKIKAQLNQKNLENILKNLCQEQQITPQIFTRRSEYKNESQQYEYQLHNYKISRPKDLHTQESREEKIQQNLKKYGKPVLTLNSELDFIYQAWGSGIFGCGGGGSCEMGEFQLKTQFKKFNQPVHIYSLDNMEDKDIVSVIGFAGVPTLLNDRLFTVYEIQNTFDNAVQYSKDQNREITGLIDLELGGTNGLIPLLISQKSGYPVFDGHMMDRAYPRITQSILTPFGLTGCPLTVGDHNGKINHSDMTGEDYIKIILQNRENAPDFDFEKESQALKPVADTINRENFDKFISDVKSGKLTDVTFSNPLQLMIVANLINNNGITSFSLGNMNKQNANKMLYKNCYQKSYLVGKAMYDGIHNKKLPVPDVIQSLSPIFKQFQSDAKDVKILGIGRIQNKISEKLSGGQDVGNFQIIGEDKDNIVKVTFQNEYLIVFGEDKPSGKYSKVLATAPDLICIVDKNNGQSIHSEETVNGIEVICFIMPCDSHAKKDGHIQFMQPTIFGENFQHHEY